MQSRLIAGWDAFALDGSVAQLYFADVVFLEVGARAECSLWRLAMWAVSRAPVGRLSVVCHDAASPERRGAKHQE